METTTSNNIPILFRVSRDLNRKLRTLADREDRSLAAQLRHLIRQATSSDDDAAKDQETAA